jgi:hypothetical protein
MTSLAISLALDVVVEWLAVLPCVWVVWVADHGLESRCPDLLLGKSRAVS